MPNEEEEEEPFILSHPYIDHRCTFASEIKTEIQLYSI